VVIGGRLTRKSSTDSSPTPTSFVRLDPGNPEEFEETLLAALGDDDWQRRLQLAEHVREHHTWERRFMEIVAATFSD
jgi:hypothetical protein